MPANGIWTGHNRSFRHAGMLDQSALQLERAEAVIGTLEDVVSAADVGKVPISIAVRHIAGAVVSSGKTLCGALFVIHVTDHQAGGPGIDRDRDLAVIGF